jgi:TfoX/Sxy family transcriptional regulator of competence genes
MNYKEDYIDFIIEQLMPWGEVKRLYMLEGCVLTRNGLMFALIGDGRLRIRGSKTNREMFIQAGVLSVDDEVETSDRPFYLVPDAVINNQQELIRWANSAYQVCLESPDE